MHTYNPLVNTKAELLEKIFINLEYGDLYSYLTANHQWNPEASRALFIRFQDDLNFIRISKKSENNYMSQLMVLLM